MPVTKDQAHMLASLAVACRPVGAPHWDAPGVVAAIGKVANLLLADVAHAVLRAAEDVTAKTPGVITATSSVHWRERSPHQSSIRPPRPDEACWVCGKHVDQCRCGAGRRPATTATDATRAAAIAKMRADVAQKGQET